MARAYSAPMMAAEGSVLGRTKNVGTPPQTEMLYKNDSAGSVGFGL